VDKATQKTAGGVGFISPTPPAPPKGPEMAPAGTVALSLEPTPLDLSGGKRLFSVEQRENRFTDGRCFYRCGFKDGATDCAVRKKSQTLKQA